MDCSQNFDALKLIREGLSQEQRRSDAPNPQLALVNEHTPSHQMVFAKAFGKMLNYYNQDNLVAGDWQRFFDRDVSVILATAAIENIDVYTVAVQEIFEFLNNLDNQADGIGLRNHLGNLFCIAGSLAKQLDLFTTDLPKEIQLKSTLTNLIQSRLAPDFQRLIAYHKGGIALALINDVVPVPDLLILGKPVVTFSNNIDLEGLSKDWITDGSIDWTTFKTGIIPIQTIYGSGVTDFDKINHVATHNLFTSIFDQFLKVYSRVVKDANRELEQTLTNWSSHKPHYSLFLSYLLLKEYARKETNTLTARHLDYYYRDILHLKEKSATPSQAHVILELAKNKSTFELKENTAFNAKKDDLNKDVIFINDRSFIANQAKVTELKTLYKHTAETGETVVNMNNRYFASPIANSEDGIGGELLSEEKSWHPFFSKTYVNGILTGIQMPEAFMGFAVSSHYLLMAEGKRVITLNITINSSSLPTNINYKDHFKCFLSNAEGWLEKSPTRVKRTSSTNLRIRIKVEGNDPAIAPYDTKIHGYHLDTTLPILLVTLRQDTSIYHYTTFQDIIISAIDLKVKVTGLKTLAVNNDFGAVDTSKPFLPFGSSPITESSFVFGSKELFQKECSSVTLKITWQVVGKKYSSSSDNPAEPQVTVSYLANGNWIETSAVTLFTGGTHDSLSLVDFNDAIIDAPDFGENEILSTSSAYGFIKVALNSSFGQVSYLNDLRAYLIAQATGDNSVDDPENGPDIPIASSFSINYTATQEITVTSSVEGTFNDRQARFFHLAPFGESEQHAYLAPLAGHQVYLFPQFDFYRDSLSNESLAEFYIGIQGLQPPQNLALLFQVSDGTADPLTKKPDPGKHIHWSYLQNNEWAPFDNNEIEDATGELTKSGIVTMAVPREATSTNTIMPSGLHWIRLAVSEKTEAICRLLTVAAQAVLTTFKDQENDPAFPSKVVAAGTITKLVNPDSGIKKITQPYDSFGGKGQESAADFFKRISERLRHKDRAITLWDYEHIVLEEFPKIYKAKCLNHTEYEPTDNALGVYRELAPGHVTIVTIPNLDKLNARNPLRPYTSLGTLLDIESFLKTKISCHVQLHVRNPQFEEVKTEFSVHFHEGYDITFYVLKLQEEITRFLSPWAYAGGGSPTFGGKIYKSVLINFIEERPWVDYIADFKLTFKAGGAVTFSKDLNEVEASTAVSILVSVPAQDHIIHPIILDEEEAMAEKCSCES